MESQDLCGHCTLREGYSTAFDAMPRSAQWDCGIASNPSALASGDHDNGSKSSPQCTNINPRVARTGGKFTLVNLDNLLDIYILISDP
ncbi:unnamed protein product [Ilex paraguariensis]|uniref:Uncharacterized protein n=1 Tax=Ilex paraguariensis TaxID=185542 RepID=A0ABC8UXR3_9AQUA